MSIAVRRLTAADRHEWLRMRLALYGPIDESATGENLAPEIDAMLAADDWATFGATDASGRLIGFVEVFERNVAEGCATSPVPFIEGLWVDPSGRRQGVARALVQAAVAWGQERGRSELASDTQLWNVRSQAMHRALGFAEAERTVAYRMVIAKP